MIGLALSFKCSFLNLSHCLYSIKIAFICYIVFLRMENSTIEATCHVLVNVFGFSREKAIQAINAVNDKSNVELAWNWLLDNGEDDSGGPVIPSQM
jgi:hypothetical protein